MPEETQTPANRAEYLAEKYVKQPSSRKRRRHPMDDYLWEFHESIERLRRADEVLEFLDRTARDPYTTLRSVDEVLNDAEYGLQNAQAALDASGFLEMLDDHLESVMSAVDPELLPPGEAAVLDYLGFPRLARYVREETDLVGTEWRAGTARGVWIAREFREQPATRMFEVSIERIQRHRTELREHAATNPPTDQAGRPGARDVEPQPRKSRRWWKGLGQIVEGATLAVADAGLAVGLYKVQIPEETQLAGTVVSVGAGIGKVMNGVGDLLKE
jgi:hypothetical protein